MHFLQHVIHAGGMNTGDKGPQIKQGHWLLYDLPELFWQAGVPSAFVFNVIRYYHLALASVAQWIECWPVSRKIPGSIPGQGTCLHCGPGRWLGACKRQTIDASLTHCCFSPSLSPCLCFSPKINK